MSRFGNSRLFFCWLPGSYRPLRKMRPPPEPGRDFRYAFSAIDDATFDSDLRPPLPATATMLKDPSVTLLQNQLLLEPSFTLRYRSRWSLASSVVGLADTFHGLSAADFDPPTDDRYRNLQDLTPRLNHTLARAPSFASKRHMRASPQATSTLCWAEELCAGARVMHSLPQAFSIRHAIPPIQPTA